MCKQRCFNLPGDSTSFMDVLAICTNIPFNDLNGEQSIPLANVQNSVKDTGSAWTLFRADQHQCSFSGATSALPWAQHTSEP